MQELKDEKILKYFQHMDDHNVLISRDWLRTVTSKIRQRQSKKKSKYRERHTFLAMQKMFEEPEEFYLPCDSLNKKYQIKYKQLKK